MRVPRFHLKNGLIRVNLLSILLLSTLLVGSVPKGEEPSRKPKANSKGAKIISKFKYPEIHWKVPEVGEDVKRIEMENGMILYLKEDHNLSLINLQAIIRTGAFYEPKEKEGLANLTGRVLRTGGTQNLSGDELDRELEYIAANLSTSIGDESGRASLNVLKKNFDKALTHFAELLMSPRFEQEKIDLAKKEIKESIRRQNDSPGSILSREFYKLIYGDHPYGRSLEWEPISKIARKDLIAFHKKYFHPNNIILGITGDFNEGEMIEKIKRNFRDWKSSTIDFPEVPKVEEKFTGSVNLIPKEINQTNIRIGHLGVDRTNPDIYAITLMNFVLGGGSFTSRMTERVRSDEGLAYSVGSRFQTDTQDLGAFYANCQTKTETTHRTIDILLEEIEKIRNAPVEDWELELGKNVYINRYVFNWTSTVSIVSQLMFLEYNNRPRDYYQTYLDKIRAVTKEDIQRVAKEYLHPDRLCILVVGDSENFDKPLDDLGEVKVISLKEPILPE
ncbi:insulinase family protein [candidate division TA06 bacterium]|nr:insulinase family protein [candidate division TA06 bacterium]